ncbi:MAG TPA: WYL domain-containing protein [Gemmatimonadaceae bacterium]|nr:WYL domain-containing protein [Gemmatimonadaceae bacterium]
MPARKPTTTERASAARAPSPSASSIAKLQRWIDLLAALLSRRFPAPLAELVRDVPAYRASPSDDALARMFERDKEELRAFGVPIETVQLDEETSGYLLRARDFYLPILTLPGVVKAASRARDRSGYRSLEHLTFEPDELEAVAHAGARVRALGDPLLTADADSALRKLAFDLPVDSARHESEERVLADGRGVDARAFALLGGALLRRKRVCFDYHAMSTDATTRREVEPYGLVFLGAHWYLVGRDVASGERRNFRVSRMRAIEENRARPRTPDFEPPAAFDLAEHARSRQAWELGDDDAREVIVEFRASTGAARAAAGLGEPVRGAPSRRRFRVRRPDTFARWLLSLAGDAVPVEPPEMVQRWRAIARATLAVYEPGDRAREGA